MQRFNPLSRSFARGASSSNSLTDSARHRTWPAPLGFGSASPSLFSSSSPPSTSAVPSTGSSRPPSTRSGRSASPSKTVGISLFVILLLTSAFGGFERSQLRLKTSLMVVQGSRSSSSRPRSRWGGCTTSPTREQVMIGRLPRPPVDGSSGTDQLLRCFTMLSR